VAEPRGEPLSFLDKLPSALPRLRFPSSSAHASFLKGNDCHPFFSTSLFMLQLFPLYGWVCGNSDPPLPLANSGDRIDRWSTPDVLSVSPKRFRDDFLLWNSQQSNRCSFRTLVNILSAQQLMSIKVWKGCIRLSFLGPSGRIRAPTAHHPDFMDFVRGTFPIGFTVTPFLFPVSAGFSLR